MTDPDDHEKLRNDFTFALMTLKSLLEPIQDAVEGYREDMLKRGYTEDQSREMAVQYHGGVIRMIMQKP